MLQYSDRPGGTTIKRSTRSDAVGAFGFLGIAGLLASPAIVKATDRFTPRLSLIVGALALIMASLLVAEAAHCFILLIAAIVLTDLGNPIGLIANQTRIYALSVEARSRRNTVFLTSYFLGGAPGAALPLSQPSILGGLACR